MIMSEKAMYKWLPIGLLVLLLSLLAYMLFVPSSESASRGVVPVHGIYFTEPNYLNPFELKSTSKNGKFNDQDLLGHWTIMFFGFTHCPDICPTTLAMLNTVVNDFKKASPKAKAPKVVFVSVDPERDHLQMLKKYVTYFNPNFTAATGSEDDLRRLTRQAGIVFDKVVMDDDQPNNYVVEHSTSIILINPKGAMQAVFTAPHNETELAEDLVAVYSAYQQGK